MAKEVYTVSGRYKLPNGKWSGWAIFDSYKEAKEMMEYQADGRGYQIKKEVLATNKGSGKTDDRDN